MSQTRQTETLRCKPASQNTGYSFWDELYIRAALTDSNTCYSILHWVSLLTYLLTVNHYLFFTTIPLKYEADSNKSVNKLKGIFFLEAMWDLLVPDPDSTLMFSFEKNFLLGSKVRFASPWFNINVFSQ